MVMTHSHDCRLVHQQSLHRAYSHSCQHVYVMTSDTGVVHSDWVIIYMTVCCSPPDCSVQPCYCQMHQAQPVQQIIFSLQQTELATDHMVEKKVQNHSLANKKSCESHYRIHSNECPGHIT